MNHLDDPELDGTDFAHPAWWRGHDAAVSHMCALIHEWANKIGLSIFAELNALNSEEQCKRWLANHGTKWLARIKELQASYVAEPANSPRYMVFAALNGTLSSLLRDLNQTRATQLTLE